TFVILTGHIDGFYIAPERGNFFLFFRGRIVVFLDVSVEIGEELSALPRLVDPALCLCLNSPLQLLQRFRIANHSESASPSSEISSSILSARRLGSDAICRARSESEPVSGARVDSSPK